MLLAEKSVNGITQSTAHVRSLQPRERARAERANIAFGNDVAPLGECNAPRVGRLANVGGAWQRRARSPEQDRTTNTAAGEDLGRPCASGIGKRPWKDLALSGKHPPAWRATRVSTHARGRLMQKEVATHRLATANLTRATSNRMTAAVGRLSPGNTGTRFLRPSLVRAPAAPWLDLRQACGKARNSIPLLNEESTSPPFSTGTVRTAEQRLATMDGSSRTGRSLDGGVIEHGDSRGIRWSNDDRGDEASDALVRVHTRRLQSESPAYMSVFRSQF
jgi:hypothetical protein